MPKNCVVSINPVCAVPVAEAGPVGVGPEGAGRVLVEPYGDDQVGGAGPDGVGGLISALPPVAQPLATLMNGTPVRPSRLTSVSAAPAARLPP